MIHTDGTPTIASAHQQPTAATCSSDPVWAPSPDTVLCERETAGLKVALLRIGNVSVIALKEGEQLWDVKSIPSDKALDAFNHPYLYIDA